MLPVLVDNQRYTGQPKVELTGQSILLEQRLIPITQELNSHPLRVNQETWLKQLEKAEEAAHFHIDFCRQLASDDLFRPGSTADCSRALYVIPGRKPQAFTPTKQPATDKDTLLELANEGVELAQAIVEARSAISCWSQVKAWGPYAKVGFVQATWNSLGTPHGRYASEGPNLNNRIPAIRATIEPDPGSSFLSCDLSQAEYVTWSSLSKDPILSRLFLEGRDLHQETAQAVKGLVPNWNLRGEDLRSAGKTINFALLYLMKTSTLAAKLGTSFETAAKIVKVCQVRAPRAISYIDTTIQNAKAEGFVATYFGRRRYTPELRILTADKDLHEAEKTAWNHHNAGTTAELTKRKQILVWEALRREGLTPQDVRLSIQGYDELVFQCRDSLLAEARQIIEPIWRKQDQGFLPFQSIIKVGSTWAEISK